MDGDGLEKLDFTYIEDLVNGVTRVIENPKSRNEIFNITHGQSRTIKELAEIVLKQFPNTRVQRVERDKLMPFRGTLNVNKAKTLLGYAPSFPIEKGFVSYIDWYKTRPSRASGTTHGLWARTPGYRTSLAGPHVARYSDEAVACPRARILHRARGERKNCRLENVVAGRFPPGGRGRYDGTSPGFGLPLADLPRPAAGG